MLAHAINSTNPTTPIRTNEAPATGPASSSRTGSSRARWRLSPARLWGFMRRASVSYMAFAWAMRSPGFNRPMAPEVNHTDFGSRLRSKTVGVQTVVFAG